MQSFIVNVPDDKEAFFLELIGQLGFEILDIDEQPLAGSHDDEQSADPFLDWETERKTVKEVRKKK